MKLKHLDLTGMTKCQASGPDAVELVEVTITVSGTAERWKCEQVAREFYCGLELTKDDPDARVIVNALEDGITVVIVG